MSTVIDGRCLERARVSLTHLPTGAALVTDPAREMGGDGTSFSPIDILAAALGACVMGVVGMVAARMKLDLAGMRMEVGREIARDPWRVAGLSVVMHLPAHVAAEARQQIELATRRCPVRNALHPDVQVEIEFRYDA